MGTETVNPLESLERRVRRCRRCPELRDYCAQVAKEKRRAYEDWRYWGKPVPGFGDPDARIWVLGLAPAAHGANRTGRMFTGDRSGDFLYGALYRAGLSNQAESISRDDGLKLRGVFISSACRCAPPANKPSRQQQEHCASYLDDEHAALEHARVLLCLGGIAWDAALRLMSRHGNVLPRPRPRFGHGVELALGSRVLLGCYHVSQQNTFTGRLTEPMLNDVLRRAVTLAGERGQPQASG